MCLDRLIGEFKHASDSGLHEVNVSGQRTSLQDVKSVSGRVDVALVMVGLCCDMSPGSSWDCDRMTRESSSDEPEHY